MVGEEGGARRKSLHGLCGVRPAKSAAAAAARHPEEDGGAANTRGRQGSPKINGPVWLPRATLEAPPTKSHSHLAGGCEKNKTKTTNKPRGRKPARKRRQEAKINS